MFLYYREQNTQISLKKVGQIRNYLRNKYKYQLYTSCDLQFRYLSNISNLSINSHD